MKISLLKIWVRWRRLRRGTVQSLPRASKSATQVESLMSRANPFGPWEERANWLIDVAEWLRRDPVWSLRAQAGRQETRQQRITFLLDWLDTHRDIRRLVRATLQKTLREAAGPELFFSTGMPHAPAFVRELWDRLIGKILPKSPAPRDLPALFAAMFPEQSDGDWLLSLDPKVLARIAKLCTDETVADAYRRQIEDALLYLASLIVAVGISPEFRKRLAPATSLQQTPFMSLRRELEMLLADPLSGDTHLRGVRRFIAICQAQTDRIYAELHEYGVSVALVYSIERMRAQLARMARLIDLRAALMHSEHGAAATVVHVRELLVDQIGIAQQRASVRGLVKRSTSLLARKMVEHDSDDSSQNEVRHAGQYGAVFRSALRGGAVVALAVLAGLAIPMLGLPRYAAGPLLAVDLLLCLLLIGALKGVLAGKPPALSAAALASKMRSLDTLQGMRALLQQSAALLRAQAAAVFGNLVTVIPLVAGVSLALLWHQGSTLMPVEQAQATIQSLSLLGPTPWLAALTGVALWLSSVAAGVAGNWFALRRLRDSLSHHRRLMHALGPARARRWAHWLERHLPGIAGNLVLAGLLGMGPIVAQYLGLPLDVRHVALAAGSLAAAAFSLGGGEVFAGTPFWLAVAGLVSIAVLNVGVAFGCAFALALRARAVPGRTRRRIMKALLRRLLFSPGIFLFPERRSSSRLPDLPALPDKAMAKGVRNRIGRNQ